METRIEKKTVEYVIIGAGPAAICAIPQLIKKGVSGSQIVWIDPYFTVGDFGTKLSTGTSVPGNTTVKSYQRVNREIYKIIPECAPGSAQRFAIDALSPDFVCTLKVAAEPLQHITHGLRKIVSSIEGKVNDIISSSEEFKVVITLADGSLKQVITKRVILATGANPRTLQLPAAHSAITMIDPNIVFIQSELANYLLKHPMITTVAVIGSSHSAALAVMHLLKAGLSVKQFMNKEYLFATPTVGPNGIKFTKFDNTGLKGDVAQFTQQLLVDLNSGKGEYKNKFTRYIGKDKTEVNALLEQHLVGCSHAVAAIGYETANTLRVNNLPITSLHHNNKTTEFNDVKGLFGIGVAFPLEVQAISGEIEFAVGVEKFWTTASHTAILKFMVDYVTIKYLIKDPKELSCMESKTSAP